MRDDEDLSARALMQRDIEKLPKLTEQQVEAYLALYDTPLKDWAAEQLFKGNLRLVMKIVSEQAIRYGIGDEQRRLDLCIAGMVALNWALPKFDPHRLNAQGKPNKISTYVYEWIQRAVAREIVQERTMMRGQDPTQSILSLDVPTGESEDGSYYDILADEHAEEPSLVSDQSANEMLVYLWRTLGGSTSDLRMVRMAAELRLGLRDGTERTLKEVGQQFGPIERTLTRESVRQEELRFYEWVRSRPDVVQWLRDRVED